MISLQKLIKRFGGQTAADALSLEIPAGQIVGFLGPNGAGKSYASDPLRLVSSVGL